MSGILVGYARVSTDAQDLTAQRDALTALGVAASRIYVDHGLTGRRRDRPGLREAMAACRASDTLVVTKLDRLARSLPDARDIVEELTSREVSLGIAGLVGCGVAQKRGLNRAVVGRGWAELERQLEYKAGWYGPRLVRVAARNTSITCARCNTVDKASCESQARFRCRHCGHQARADVNAARVILARALDNLAGGPSVTARGHLQKL